MATMMGKSKTVFDCDEWDSIVKSAYGKANYSIQQQDGCYENGSSISFSLPVSDGDKAEWYRATEIPYEINGQVMGVSLEAWLNTDEDSFPYDYPYYKSLWYERNFYPHFLEIANDLLKKGLLAEGDYVIAMDW